MSTAQAEALFSTARLDVVFLSPELSADADKVALAAPKFFQAEYESSPEAGFVAELLQAPPPPGVSRVAVFPMGLKEKGKSDFVGIAHLVLGYPTETAVFLGLLMVTEAKADQGFAEEFIAGIYNWARPQGIGFIRARVNPKNTDARSLFDKLGFADLPTKLSTGHEVWERHLPAVED